MFLLREKHKKKHRHHHRHRKERKEKKEKKSKKEVRSSSSSSFIPSTNLELGLGIPFLPLSSCPLDESPLLFIMLIP